ncbi:hypothetical protein BU16DRAFT_168194 [Lophium mytilinum]|uniref:F-box domain-containing protein n=1 Tax=Lophium mytilinum TaxID=390894 RepID=A0A6A6QE88_9PEZI|nr:hypothetical protein BU16DRAFT_168194 [Lophium mytilinum]
MPPSPGPDRTATVDPTLTPTMQSVDEADLEVAPATARDHDKQPEMSASPIGDLTTALEAAEATPTVESINVANLKIAPSIANDREIQPDKYASPDGDLTTAIEPTEATSSPSNQAVHAVFATYELLEEILTYLPPREICRAQMVNCTWRDVVRSSLSLQRNAFLVSAFPPVVEPSGEYSLFKNSFWTTFYGKLSFVRDEITAVNPVIYKLFHSGVLDGQSLGCQSGCIRCNVETGQVIVNISESSRFSPDYKAFIPIMKSILGINVDIPGWNKDAGEASWRQMLVMDPPGTSVAIVVSEVYGNYIWDGVHIREWTSPSLTIGELIDQIVMQLVEDKHISGECGEGVVVSKSTKEGDVC